MAKTEIDEYMEMTVKKLNDFYEEDILDFCREFDVFLKKFEKEAKALAKAKKTGDYSIIDKCDNSKGQKDRDSLKENSCPNNKEKQIKKNVLSIKQERISTVSNNTNSDVNEMPAPTIVPPKKKRVKKEKLSTVVKVKKEPINDVTLSTRSTRSTRSKASTVDRNSDVIVQNPNVSLIELTDSDEEKKESKKPVRSTRTRTKKLSESNENIAQSSVRCTRSRQRTVKNNEDEENPVRTTRTRTKAKVKRDRSHSEESKRDNTHKRSKSDPKNEREHDKNDTVRTEYEDALSTLDNRPEDATFILPKKETASETHVVPSENNMIMMDKTMVLRKSKEKEKNLPEGPEDDLLTEDESVHEEQQVAVSPQKSGRVNKKEVFSPYERSPVKKKVEAFENLKKNESHVTSKANTSRVLKEIEEKKGNVREKAKGFTPVSSKTLYKSVTSSTSKINKYVGYPHSSTSANNNTSIKAATPIRQPVQQSRSEFRERELKRQERHKELKKQELAKRAVSEEKKKRYEEKVIRVQQQQKEALEKEKKRALEVQKLKEERHKMMIKEKEEKLRLMKEEHERKRLLAKMRAEEKRKEEERMAAELSQEKERKQRELLQQQKEQHNEVTSSVKKVTATSQQQRQMQQAGDLPRYLREPTPRLPTKDCYDSDEEVQEQQQYKRKVPAWCGSLALDKASSVQTAAGHRLKNTLFCCANQYVDLQEIFQRIDPRKLKRTSSACWAKPPRYTMLPGYNEDEEND